jgi:hypothetical protein
MWYALSFPLHIGGIPMPWMIVRREGKSCVIKKDSGEVKKCYDNRKEALAYLRALYTNTKDEEYIKEKK